jgi:hypothetical protein
MLRGSLGEDINSEVGLVDLIVILLFVLFRHCLSLSLETCKSTLEFLLLISESLLDDLSPGKQSLLKILESLVLDMDSSLLIEVVTIGVERKFLQDRDEEVTLGLLFDDVILLELLLVVLVSSLLVDTLVKDLEVDLFFDVLHSETLNASLVFTSADSLSIGLLLMSLDLGMALLLHLTDLVEELLLLVLIVIFLSILFVHVSHLTLADKISSIDLFRLSEDLSLLVMVVNEHKVLLNVELCLSNLKGSILLLVQLKLLSHLFDKVELGISSIFDVKMLCLVNCLIRIISDTSVDELVLSALVSFKDLSTNLLLSIDETIRVSVMVEVYLAISIVNFDELLPVILFLGGLIMLDAFEHVWQSSPENELVFTVFEERTHFFGDQPLVVIIDGDPLHKSIYLFVVRVELNLALLVEHGLLSLWTKLSKLLLVNKEFWTPWWWHV